MADRNKPNDRRFLLMTSDKSVEDYFRRKADVVLEKRYLFDYFGQRDLMKPDLPAGYEMKEIEGRILGEISGGIVPSLFWKNADDFLMSGKGYCITCGHDIASWAFSAAVSSKEIDMGIETNPKYKQQGLGMIVAEKMIQYAVLQEKKPAWACHYKNVASKRLAEKLGFIKMGECSVIKHKG